jgi:hypothetical protein
MKIIVKIKFDTGNQKIESFGNNRYLVYLTSKREDPSSMDEFVSMMSKYMTVPPNRVHFKGKEGESFVFDVD